MSSLTPSQSWKCSPQTSRVEEELWRGRKGLQRRSVGDATPIGKGEVEKQGFLFFTMKSPRMGWQFRCCTLGSLPPTPAQGLRALAFPNCCANTPPSRTVGLDPGKKNVLTISDLDGNTLKYTIRQRNFESKLTRYRKVLSWRRSDLA